MLHPDVLHADSLEGNVLTLVKKKIKKKSALTMAQWAMLE